MVTSEQETMTHKNKTESKVGSHAVGHHNTIIQTPRGQKAYNERTTQEPRTHPVVSA